MGADYIKDNWVRCAEDSTLRATACRKCELADALPDEEYCGKCLNDLALALIDEREGAAADAAYLRMQRAAKSLVPPITSRPISTDALDKAAQRLSKAIVALERKRMVS